MDRQCPIYMYPEWLQLQTFYDGLSNTSRILLDSLAGRSLQLKTPEEAIDAASAIAHHSVFSITRPAVFTCNAIIVAMYRAKRYHKAIVLFHFFFNQSNIVPNIISYNNLINTHCDMGNVDVAIEIYRHVIANAPFSPYPVSYRHHIKGLIDAGRIGEAVYLLREMLTKGTAPILWCTII
ncbi:hypothetical protein PIB30_090161 [Stylosanthes scabra]|uniref:Pentatricopeptide repeat-containing protein n=1 Tax=Stylosanthes scabra TaxID=79078 RepID=A0ABU6ZST6_9FABA|nr:hypothetical protein [Stylosanthes scabra]